MTCRDLTEFIADHLEGRLAPAVRASFQRHLAQCPNCVRYLSQYEATIAAGRAAFDDPGAPVPPTVPEDLVRAILASRKP